MASCNEACELERVGRFFCRTFLAGSAHRSGNECCYIVCSMRTSACSVKGSCGEMGTGHSALLRFHCFADLVNWICSQRNCVGLRRSAHRLHGDLWKRSAPPNDLHSPDMPLAYHRLNDPGSRMGFL